jgi:hypothetical protein
MLNAPAHGPAASCHAESLLLPALYNSRRATIAPDRHYYLGTNLELDAWPATDAPSNSPAGTARPRLEPGRQTRRAAKVGRVHPNHPAAFRQGMPKGFDPPGQHNLPKISGMRKRTQVCLEFLGLCLVIILGQKDLLLIVLGKVVFGSLIVTKI